MLAGFQRCQPLHSTTVPVGVLCRNYCCAVPKAEARLERRRRTASSSEQSVTHPPLSCRHPFMSDFGRFKEPPSVSIRPPSTPKIQIYIFRFRIDDETRSPNNRQLASGCPPIASSCSPHLRSRITTITPSKRLPMRWSRLCPPSAPHY